MKVVIVKYNAGNVQSVRFALERLGVQAAWTDDPEEIRQADRVIFPGVGEASSAMEYLNATGLSKVIAGLSQPVLGICLGLQLFCKHSEEGNTDCLNIVDVQVRKFQSVKTLKVPHIGWNTVENLQGPLFKGIEPDTRFYFVHSFYAEASPFTTASTEYGLNFSAAMQRDNFFAVQFHPEKSGPAGSLLLQNFLSL
ncbi:MAG: imidazole glycerol phosphate synthase subunit HisH [Bacteroidota bacterium]